MALLEDGIARDSYSISKEIKYSYPATFMSIKRLLYEGKIKESSRMQEWPHKIYYVKA